MVYRDPNAFDGTIGGYNFRLKRDSERPYAKQWQRSGVPFNQSEEHDGKFNTRQDIRTLFQTSWADGSFWNKPLLSAVSISSYYTAEGIDVLTEPGSLLPMGTVTSQTGQEGSLTGWCALAIGGDIFVAGDQDGGNIDGYVYDASAGSWGATTADFNTTEYPVAMCYHEPVTNYMLLTSDGEINWMDRDQVSTGTVIDITSVAGDPQVHGSNIFMHFGRLFVYTGSALWEIADPFGSPSVVSTAIYDDGMGPDWLNDAASNDGSNALIRDYSTRLAVATSEGIYIVKNVEQEGVPTAFITRVDRTAAGTDVGAPAGTLPPGYVALDCAWALGSLLIAATSDYEQVIENDVSSEYPGITIFFVSEQNGLGTVGSPLGYESPDEAPYKFAGMHEDRVFIGGQKRLWAYDVVRGGLHPLIDKTDASEPGRVITFVTPTLDGSGNRVYRAMDDEGRYWDIERFTGTDNDSLTRELESNYFDFNIPAEQKTITHVTLMTDGAQSGETWTVQLSADDASFATASTHDSSDTNTLKQRITPVTGYRFRYKLTYAASGAVASPSRVKGIVFHAIQGELVASWRLEVDGKEFRNIENQVVDPDTVLSNMETVAADETVLTFVDEFKTTSSTHNVKVQAVTVSRSMSSEIDSVELILIEDT